MRKGGEKVDNFFKKLGERGEMVLQDIGFREGSLNYIYFLRLEHIWREENQSREKEIVKILEIQEMIDETKV